MNLRSSNYNISSSSHCRIGKVTLKGGAQLHLIETVPDQISSRISELLELDAAQICDDTDCMAGYFVVAWDRKKRLKYGGLHSDELLPMGFDDMSDLVKEATYRWKISSIAEDVKDDDFDGEISED